MKVEGKKKGLGLVNACQEGRCEREPGVKENAGARVGKVVLAMGRRGHHPEDSVNL